MEAIDSRLERIAGNQEQSDRHIFEPSSRLEGLTRNVNTLAALMGQQFGQAGQDRAEFRAIVTGILDTLKQGSSGNRHL